MKYIIRILVSPLVFSLVFISFTYQAFEQVATYIKYGGELVPFRKDDSSTIRDILQMFKHIREKTSAS